MPMPPLTFGIPPTRPTMDLREGPLTFGPELLSGGPGLLSRPPSMLLDHEEEYPSYEALGPGPIRQPWQERFARKMPTFGLDVDDAAQRDALKAALMQAGFGILSGAGTVEGPDFGRALAGGFGTYRDVLTQGVEEARKQRVEDLAERRFESDEQSARARDAYYRDVVAARREAAEAKETTAEKQDAKTKADLARLEELNLSPEVKTLLASAAGTPAFDDMIRDLFKGAIEEDDDLSPWELWKKKEEYKKEQGIGDYAPDEDDADEVKFLSEDQIYDIAYRRAKDELNFLQKAEKAKGEQTWQAWALQSGAPKGVTVGEGSDYAFGAPTDPVAFISERTKIYMREIREQQEQLRRGGRPDAGRPEPEPETPDRPPAPPPIEARMSQISAQVREGIPAEVWPSVESRIRDLLEQGKSPEQIVAWIEQMKGVVGGQ